MGFWGNRFFENKKKRCDISIEQTQENKFHEAKEANKEAQQGFLRLQEQNEISKTEDVQKSLFQTASKNIKSFVTHTMRKGHNKTNPASDEELQKTYMTKKFSKMIQNDTETNVAIDANLEQHMKDTIKNVSLDQSNMELYDLAGQERQEIAIERYDDDLPILSMDDDKTMGEKTTDKKEITDEEKNQLTKEEEIKTTDKNEIEVPEVPVEIDEDKWQEWQEEFPNWQNELNEWQEQLNNLYGEKQDDLDKWNEAYENCLLYFNCRAFGKYCPPFEEVFKVGRVAENVQRLLDKEEINTDVLEDVLYSRISSLPDNECTEAMKSIKKRYETSIIQAVLGNSYMRHRKYPSFFITSFHVRRNITKFFLKMEDSDICKLYHKAGNAGKREMIQRIDDGDTEKLKNLYNSISNKEEQAWFLGELGGKKRQACFLKQLGDKEEQAALETNIKETIANASLDQSIWRIGY